jgi:Protein of unknown function (DUF1257)
MSHFTELKTKLNDRNVLKKALTALGFTLVEDSHPVQVRGFFGSSVEAEFKILTDTHYDIGFVKAEGGYEIVGDWDLLPQVSGIEKESFSKKLKREYAKVAITELAKSGGYELDSVESEDGSIEMVVRQW